MCVLIAIRATNGCGGPHCCGCGKLQGCSVAIALTLFIIWHGAAPLTPSMNWLEKLVSSWNAFRSANIASRNSLKLCPTVYFQQYKKRAKVSFSFFFIFFSSFTKRQISSQMQSRLLGFAAAVGEEDFKAAHHDLQSCVFNPL